MEDQPGAVEGLEEVEELVSEDGGAYPEEAYGRLIFKWVARICLQLEHTHPQLNIERLKREMTPPRLETAGSFFYTVMLDAGVKAPSWETEHAFNHKWYVVVRGLAECYSKYDYKRAAGGALYRAGWSEGMLSDLIVARGQELDEMYIHAMRVIGRSSAKAHLTEMARLVLYQNERYQQEESIPDTVRMRIAKGYAIAKRDKR